MAVCVMRFTVALRTSHVRLFRFQTVFPHCKITVAGVMISLNTIFTLAWSTQILLFFFLGFNISATVKKALEEELRNLSKLTLNLREILIKKNRQTNTGRQKSRQKIDKNFGRTRQKIKIMIALTGLRTLTALHTISGPVGG